MNFNDDGPISAKRQKLTKVRNKQPAPVQITSEQLLREAKERELEATPKPPQQIISTEEEKKDYQLQKRQDYENNIRKSGSSHRIWINYANFEISQGEIVRARNVFERALNKHFKDISIWIKYAEMEIEYKQVNRARNLYERSLALLPRMNQLWYKYVYMEQKLKNIEAARRIFKQWMRWKPDEQAWQTYINFELNYGERSNIREIYQNFVQVHQDEKNWIKWAHFESRTDVDYARRVYETSLKFYGKDNPQPKLLLEFARFEEHNFEQERVQAIYKYAIDNLPESMLGDIYKAYHEFEKKFGDKTAIQQSIVIKRRSEYESILKKEPNEYSQWLDFCLMMIEEKQPVEQTREIFERAISNKPPMERKYYWRCYIYLWILYAQFEEIHCQDKFRAKEVYKVCLQIIPHKKFTFGKIWINWAEICLRERDVDGARKVLGNSIGRCPKNKLYKYYIEMEKTLREWDRVRTLYKKFISICPSFETPWIEFANFEEQVKQYERTRAIFEKALNEELENPLYIWKEYIDFECRQDNYENCAKLHRRLLKIEDSVRIWISFAETNLLGMRDDNQDEVIESTRAIFEEANEYLKRNGHSSKSRKDLLAAWLEFEELMENNEAIDRVKHKMPQTKTTTKRIDNDDGTTNWVEEATLIFPDDMEVAQMEEAANEFADIVDDF